MNKKILKKIGSFFAVSISCLLLFSLVVFISACSSFGTKPSESQKNKFEISKQFNKESGVFENRDKTIFERMSKRNKMTTGVFNFLFGKDNFRVPKAKLPVLHPTLEEFLKISSDIKIIWFGHSTFMLNLNGKIILVDPIFSTYASPVPFIIGRFQETPLSLDELPNIDFILISHDHYDHLDLDTIKFFKDKTTKFLTPLGVGSHLRGWGIQDNRIFEFDWWQSLKISDVEFIATPSQHFSGRSFSDRNSTLWAGWVIRNQFHNIFYSGDSGYDIHFKAIGDTYGPFDLALLDNGQYNKQWEEVHLMPEQGIQAIKDLRAKVFFPVHWGAFKLSIHSWFEPIQKAYEYSNTNNIKIIAPKIGEVVILDEKYRVFPWWSELIKLEISP